MSKFAYFNRFRSHDAVNRRGHDNAPGGSDVAHNKTSTARPLITGRGPGPGRGGCVVAERGRGGDAQNNDTGGGNIWACCWQMWWVPTNVGASVGCLTSFRFRCVCPSLTDRKKRISKSYRTCRSTTNQSNCCATISDPNNPNSPLVGDALSDEQRHTGGRGPDELWECQIRRCGRLYNLITFRCSGPGSNVHSRARPLYIPSNEWTGHHHEPDHKSQGRLVPAVQVQQPKRQPERPTELFLPTKQLENGHANPKSQASTYMEQFWICTKRWKQRKFSWSLE